MSRRRRALALAVATPFRADPWRSTAVLVLSAAGSLIGVLGAFWLKRIVDGARAGDETATLAAAVSLGSTMALGMLARSSVTRMLFPLKEITGLYVDRRIIGLLGGIAGIEHHERPAYLDKVEVLRREAPVLGFAGTNTADALAVLVQAGATGALLVSVSPVLLGVPLFAIASFAAGARAERIRHAALDATANGSRHARHLFELATSPAAAKELRLFGLGDELLRRHRAAWQRIDSSLDRAALSGLAWTAAGWLFFALGYAGAVTLVVARAVRGDATLGDVVLALALMALINRQISLAANTLGLAVRTLGVADRYLWLAEYARASAGTVDDPAPAPDRLVHGIELRGIAFRYPETDVEVLRGLDLLLPAGSTVAVVGDNGAGKSTLVKLLCRLYEPSEGVITVDGTDLRRIDVGEWRKRMSAGFQDFARLELTALHTVGVGDLRAADDVAAVTTALERAASTDVVASLPDGLETQLGRSFDAGAELSGGQWQKLALARAMMRPSPLLLVLDEPTAALDAATEHTLFARYAAAASAVAAHNGAITLIVSHRFSTVRTADLIVVLDGGRIVAAGSHDQLMESGGLYAELYELQARHYR